ncbi:MULTISPECIES: YkvA family protein [unclassified Microbulbifer]|uniref:YkvA family protein n=1 Tax=unclassified Microbulbifer TaxID=2619833 RepID=UPI0027E40169|nr:MULTISPECIES: YkvA family protein [unclassified Microbulbifer]
MPTRLKRFAREMKLQLRVLYLASRDPRTPLVAKLVLLAIVAYALSPIDLIPDFIPVLGYLDDLILLPLGIWLAIRLVPPELWRELRARAEAKPISLPKNRRAGAFIVIFWIAALAALAYWIQQRFLSGA